MLFNPTSATYADYWLKPFKAAAPSFAVEAIAAPVRNRSELETVIAAQARAPNGSLIAMPDSFTDTHRVEITSLAVRYRLPAVFWMPIWGPDRTSIDKDLTRSFASGLVYVVAMLIMGAICIAMMAAQTRVTTPVPSPSTARVRAWRQHGLAPGA
jgi:hypothetical protein